ncbi:SPOR domain-containing protein [Novosphingobium sp.]|uniref:SPOR domain-containing protein n=1 Tax=Novosphingobium sp. TaxID=1874826 RepID=UPI002FDE1A9A
MTSRFILSSASSLVLAIGVGALSPALLPQAHAQGLSGLPSQSVMDAPGTPRATPYPAQNPARSVPVYPANPTYPAQAVPTVSRPVVQPLPSAGTANASQALNAALGRLAREPGSVDALVDAGDAAMALGDMDAAMGFFRRAADIAPTNGKVQAQIGRAMVRANDPLAAIRAFDLAERAGADMSAVAADRGLAHDLAGDFTGAQGYYRQALARGYDAEVTRKLALSLAIGGDRAAAEQVLQPQLSTSDRAAWRVKTFILAIAGNNEEAISVANSSMPPQLAAGIAPYLRYMTRLTPAQQAAAANFGRFPRAADIGRDEPQIAQYAAAHPRPTRVQVAQAAPVATPVANARRGRGGRAARATTPIAPAAAPPVLVAPPPPASQAPTILAARTPQPAPGPSFTSNPVVQAVPQPAPQPMATPAVTTASSGTATVVLPPVGQGASQPMQSVPVPAQASVPTQAPVPTQAATQPAPPTAMASNAAAPTPDAFAALFAGFSAPAEEQQRPVVAVDLAAVAAANQRAAAERAALEAKKAAEAKKLADAKKAIADRKAAAEKKLADAKKAEDARKAKEEAKRLAANPSRTWVQVLTGGDRAKMGKEWAKLQASSADLRGRRAYVTPWNRVYRLVTGPFPSDAAAQAFVAKLKGSGVSAFQFDSPAGQAMDGVAAK